MPSWVFFSFLFLVWCLWAVAGAAENAVRNAQRAASDGQRSGFSFAPIIPLFPMVCWGIAWAIDRAASPWGTWIVGVPHIGFAVLLIGAIARNWWRLRSLDGPS